MKKIIVLLFLVSGCVTYKPMPPEGEVLSQFGYVQDVKKDMVLIKFQSVVGDPQRVAVDWFYFPYHTYKKGDILKLGK